MRTIVKTNGVPTLAQVLDGVFNEVPSVANTSTLPAANVRETEDAYWIELAIPGVDKNQVSINLEENVLSISSKEKSEEQKEYKRQEFSYGKFSRKFRLPKDADKEQISASYDKGVLSVRIGKQANLSRQIEIE